MKSPVVAFATLTLTALSGGAYAREGSVRASPLRREESADTFFDPSVQDAGPSAAHASRDLQAVNSTKGLGTRSFYYVLINCQDCTPHSFTLDQWRDSHFRTSGTSFKTVMETCSNGKHQVRYNGGMTVTVPGFARDYTFFGMYVGNATAIATQTLGRDVNGMADTIIYCSPMNSAPLVGVGLQNGNRLHMNSKYCRSLSVMAHEYGHTLNLYHSAYKGDDYADYTGFMGAAAVDSDWPKKCFNGYKHYQLRWFEDRHLNLMDFTTPRRIQLAAFVDYNKTTTQHHVIVNVANIFFLQYNRAKDINSETGIQKDMVTYTQNVPWSSSDLNGGMGVGGTMVRSHNGKTLFVSVCSRVDAATATAPDVMEVTVGYHKNWCGLV